MIKSWSSIRRWPRLGKIRIGIKQHTATGKEYPKAVDYFVCPEEVQKIYGDKPKELFIMLPSDNPEDFFPQFFKKYGKSTGLVCKGDGITAIRSDEKGEMSEVECQGEKCSDYENKKCKEIANFQFFIPDVPGIGVWQIDTSSFNSIVNINSMVELLQMGNHNKLTGIPLVLRLIERDAKVEGKKKVIRILDIQIRKSMNELKKIAGSPIVNKRTKLIEPERTSGEENKQEEDPFLQAMKDETKRLTAGVEDLTGKVDDMNLDKKETAVVELDQENKDRELFVDTLKKAEAFLSKEQILKVIGNCGYTTAEEVDAKNRPSVLKVLRQMYIDNKRVSDSKVDSTSDN